MIKRRQFIAGLGSAAAWPVVARAQTYPTRPVRIVVGFAAGGGSDITARLIGQSLSERLGQQCVVENRPGAGGNIGIEAVVNALPDGYTLLLASVEGAVNATLYEKLNYNFIRDIAAVAGIIRAPYVILVNPSFPAKTVPEFISYAKAHPGEIAMASGGVGSGNHLSGELFKMMAGVNLLHVPYRGQGPALSDLLGAQVQVLFATTPGTTEYVRAGTLRALAVTSAMRSEVLPNPSVEYIRTGKLRALAVTTATRSEALPEIPTVGDFVPGFEASSWYGLGAPMNTPAEIVGVLNKEINAALVDPKIKARLTDLGSPVLPGSPADFGKLIAAETEKWGKVIRMANIKPQ